MGQHKQRARELALEWWKTSDRVAGACDKCNDNIRPGEGYLCKPTFLGYSDGRRTIHFSSPDLLCERCFDLSGAAAPFEAPISETQNVGSSAQTPSAFFIRRLSTTMTALVWCVGLMSGAVALLVTYRSYGLLISIVAGVVAFYIGAALTGSLIIEIQRSRSGTH